MSRGFYSQGKRAREADKARKKSDKMDRRMRKREEGPQEIPVETAEEAIGGLPSIEEAMAAIMDRGGSRQAAPIPARLFVGSLSLNTTAEELRAAFAEHGPIADAVVVKDRDTGRSRGFGFVTMANRKDAANAISAMHDSQLDGRMIVVNPATERSR